ncbi:LysR family transcriptional regulator [Tenacibaculum sp. SG-28]|uniref:LysR family transcriptional regulator n=1 Tax=Tenacibaculum sp. SG-28 TaxID=754426 RepID=UPI000CF552F5|nr:LysR family transcriptional regulator [Tenacibaculum sp. SG-28]PQJ23272.1 transcriptional regulator [Tenacibaculum sp. SG-28]
MSYQLEYRHLKYFLAVAEELHFRKAAEKLFISQPGLSRQIKQLEAGIGVTLFDRHNRSVVLTEAGKYLQSEITKNLNSLGAIFEHAKLIDAGKDGNLTFGYVGSAMQRIIPELLIKMKTQYPNISFGLHEMDNKRQMESLLTNDIDIGFVRMERVPRSFHVKTLLIEPFCLVLPKVHHINSENFTSLQAFKDASFILFDPKYSVSYYEKVLQIFDDAGFSPIVSHNTIHADSIYKLVASGLGVSIVPKSLTSKYQEDVQFIPLINVAQRTALSAIWSKENRNPVLQNTIALLPSVLLES